MTKKDIELFNKAIHQAKSVIADLATDIEKLKLVIDELYTLFDDLYQDNLNKEKDTGDKNGKNY